MGDILSANAPGPMIVFDPTIGSDLQVIDLVRAELDDFFLKKNIFLSHGTYVQGSGLYAGFPFLDCVNASRGSPVIKFVNSSSLNVSYEDFCLELSGSGSDLIELRDSLMYSLYGLI